MRKNIHIALAITLTMAFSSAAAYNTLGHKAIAIVAERCLTAEARTQIQAILDSPMADTPEWIVAEKKAGNPDFDARRFYFSLDKKYRCTTKSTEDGITLLEQCIEKLRHRDRNTVEQNRIYLRTVIYLVGDMHSFAHIRMEAIPVSSKPSFNVYLDNGKPGRKHAVSSCTWKKLWDGIYLTSHGAFSPEMYADDIEVCHGADKEKFSKGKPREWVEDMGREARPLYEWAGENVTISRDLRNALEPDMYRCFSKGAYRLGALLNDIFGK